MVLIICVDDNNGMMFNNRRQSQDRELRKRIGELSEGQKLFMNNYSFKQFEDYEYDNIIVDENFMDKAENGDYCFVENTDIKNYNSNIEKLIIYKWNRKYPSNVKFSLSLQEWDLKSSFDFKGYSHEKITEEVWTKWERNAP